MFQSPLKTVSEKIKPVESKSSVSSLKFERSSDFKKFINFIKNETKELEKIKLPKTAEVESKSKRGGVLGLLGLGLFGLLGSAFGDDGDGKDRFSIAGGTKSQFEKLDPIPIGGVANLRQAKVGQINLGKSLQKRRRTVSKKFMKDPELLKKEAKIKKVSSPLKDRVARRQKRLTTRKTKIIQMKSALKDLTDPSRNYREIRRPRRGRRVIKRFPTQETAMEKFQRVIKQIKNEKNPKIKARLQKQLLDEVALPVEEFEKQQFAKYTDAEMKKIKKLFSEQAQDIELQKIEKELLRDQEKELKKVRKKRYAFRGDPKLKINFDFFGKNVKFTPKDFLSGKFKQFGTATKPARDMFTKTMSKIPGSKATLGTGKYLFKSLGKKYDIITTLFEGYQLVKGFVVGDNILTAYYDLGVAIHNMFQPDKAKLMTYITNHQDSRLKVKKQEKNQKIREEIQKAKEAQALSGGFNPINKASDIVPFAVQKTGQQIMLSSPAFTGYRFILDKLYKQ